MRSPPAKRERIDSPPRASRYEEPRSRAQRYSIPIFSLAYWPVVQQELTLTSSPPRRPYSPPRDSRGYRRHSPSPRREPRVDPYAVDSWRRRSPSPARPSYPSNEASGRGSAATSRRSSPPAHQSRATLVPEERPSRSEVISPAPRSPYRTRSIERERERSPPRRRDSPPTGPREREYSNGAPLPTAPSYRNGEANFARAPPTGPAARSFTSPAMSPPVGPSSNSISMSAHARSSNPVLAAPTRPRGGGGSSGRGYTGDYPREYASAPPRRGSAHWSGGRGGPGGAPYYSGPPSGPRGSSGGGPPPFAPPFRGSSNSTSTTYPRTQRFRDHLADLPATVPGGQKAPELIDKSKIAKLEEEARKLRELIEAKQAKKRQGIREWEVLEREGNNATLRADLAEQQLRSLNGEGEVGGAAF